MNKIVDLKSKLTSTPVESEKTDFEIHHISEDNLNKVSFNNFGTERKEKSYPSETPSKPSAPQNSSSPSPQIEVDFGMFSELVANPNSKKVIRENPNAKVIINANLLTQLAAGGDAKNNNRIQVIFLIGLIIGIAFTWVLINEF